jgi:hypothetical protein
MLLATPDRRGGGGGRSIGEAASLVPTESLIEVDALMGDTWLRRALTDGLNCPSGDVVTSAEEKTVESVAEEVRWLRGGEYGGGGAGTPSVN